ncbi:MAG: SRPBCC family protein [Alkalibacterium sp.]|nr:SRPBCC family protein [Alkalibacterium sp.]
MHDYGTLNETDDRFSLKFERFYSQNQEAVFNVITDPNAFSQWYPFATGQMDLKVGGKIECDDGEGMTYLAVITKLEHPHLFSFRENEDLIDISLKEDNGGCLMVFTHTFSDETYAVNTAVGWHRCLDVLDQLITGRPLEWKDNVSELKTHYRGKF